MELQEQNIPMVDPQEGENVSPIKDEKPPVDNRGVDLAVPAESDKKDPVKETKDPTKETKDLSKTFVPDEASVTKPIIRARSSNYFSEEEPEVRDPSVANIPRLDLIPGVVTKKGVTAGIYGPEMKAEAEKSIAELQQVFTFDALVDVVNNKKDAPPEIGEDNFQRIKDAVYILNNASQFPDDINEARDIVNRGVEVINSTRKTQKFPVPFTRDDVFAPTKKALEERDLNEYDLYDAQKVYFQSRKEFYPLVQTIGDNISAFNVDDKNIIHEILMKRVTTGEFWRNLTQTGSEIINPFIVDLVPFIATTVADGTYSIAQGLSQSGNFIDEAQKAWNSREAKREKYKQAYKDFIFGSDPVLMSDYVNKAIHEELDDLLASKKITPDQHKKLTTFTDIDNKVKKRKIVSEDQAQMFLNESLQQLSTFKSALLLASENLGGAYGISKLKAAGAKKYVQNLQKTVDKYKIEQATQGQFKYAGMGTIQAARAMRADLEIFPKFNEDKFKLGLRILENEKQFVKMKKDYSKKVANLEAVKRYLINKNIDPEKNINFVKRKKEVQSLKGKIFRNVVSRRTKPIFKDAMGIAFPVTLTQLVMTETAEKLEFLDYYSAQGIGSLIHMAGYLKIPGTKMKTFGDLPKMTVNFVLSQVGNVRDVILDLGAVSKYTDELFRSKDLKEFDLLVRQRPERGGKGLTLKEKNGWSYITKLASILPAERRKEVLLNLKEQIDAEEAVIRQFPQAEQQKIRDIVQATFAQSSQLTWLKSAYILQNKEIQLGDMNSIYLMENVQALHKAKEERLEFLTLAIDNMRRKLIGRTDVKDASAVESFVKQYDDLLEAERQNLIYNQEKLDMDMDELLEHVFLDQDKNIDPKILDTLFDGNVDLQKRLQPIVDEGKAIEKTATKVFNLLATKGKSIAQNKQSKDFVNKSALTLEQVFDNHITSFYARGKAGYNDLDTIFKNENRTIDITELMFEYKEVADPEKAKNFMGFFSKTSEFYNSTPNKKLYVALREMAKRSLKGIKGKEYDELYELHTNPQSDFYIGPKEGANAVDEMDIALYWYEKGDLKAFKALPSEVTELYASFRDYAYRQDAKLGKSEMFTKFSNKAQSILELVKEQAPDYFDAFEKANKNYKKEVFDRIDGEGVLTKYMKSKTGRTTELTKSGTNVFYSNNYKGKNPQQLILEFVPDMETYLKKGEDINYINFTTKFNEFYRQMSDFTTDGKVPVFNLDDELGLAKYEAFKEALTNMMYSNWANKYLKISQKFGKKAFIEETENLTRGYNFAQIDGEKLKELSEATKVNVLKGGKIVQENMLDFTKLIEDENDIVKLLDRWEGAAETYEKFKRVGNKKILNMIKSEKSLLNRRNKAVEEIGNISGFKRNPLGFYQEYVLNGTADEIARIRSEAIKKGFTKDEFDNALIYLVNKGMEAAADLKTIAGKQVPSFDGKMTSLVGFHNPENLLKDLREKKDIFSQILGAEVAENFEQIVDLLVKERDAFSDVDRISGMVKGISNNEVISRAFNLARGMVSPTYVGAEIAFRLASNAGIEMLQLAGSSREASRLMRQMLENPEKLTPAEISRFGVLATDFVLTEYARMDITLPNWFLGGDKKENQAT